jgi:hypothetical protein
MGWIQIRQFRVLGHPVVYEAAVGRREAPAG